MKHGNRFKVSKKSKNKSRIFLFLFLFLSIGIGMLAFTLFEGEAPQVKIDKEIKFIGSRIELPLKITDQKKGLKSVSVNLVQKETNKEILSRSFPRKSWFKQAGKRELNETVDININKTGLKDGEATLSIKARDFSLNNFFKGNKTSIEIPVIIDTKAPKIQIQHSQPYIKQGGSGIVIYNVSEDTIKHGVQIDDYFFPGFKLDKNRYIAYFSAPWSYEKPKTYQVIAQDKAGNQSKRLFQPHYKKANFKKDTIKISDNFLNNKIPEFTDHYPDIPGDSMIEKYIFINNTIRQENNNTIKKICSSASSAEKLWQDSFVRMAGAGRAGFADHRTYFYQGKPIDKQVHLGMDIASTKKVPVKAANNGRVVFADYLGIYGNMVILDHGQGLFSLYSHLNNIDVDKNEMVNKGDKIGNTGTTGMAGGDHLHYSMLVNGIFVNPIEWWDQHWIDVNINQIIGND